MNSKFQRGEWPDIKPETSPTALSLSDLEGEEINASIELVSALCGISTVFARKIVGRKRYLNRQDVFQLLMLDCFTETFVPRSKILGFLTQEGSVPQDVLRVDRSYLQQGNALDLIERLPDGTVSCTVTSTPYWGVRLYDEAIAVSWADGEVCPFGHEQTPEGFIRHSVEILWRLKPKMRNDGSIWWNIGDTFNTRTQIRTNASETLKAMKGLDRRTWTNHDCRRYSAGHSYLKDGEQCLIPQRIAQRASAIGLFMRSVIIWNKNGSLPETVGTRVTRSVEYILHLTLTRAPKFNKAAYREVEPQYGGRNRKLEGDKLTDAWHLSTSSGDEGHGAQFPVSLPGRCIILSTDPGDLVLDPFVGSGNSALAAEHLDRSWIGFDVAESYIATAQRRVERLRKIMRSNLPPQRRIAAEAEILNEEVLSR